MAVRSLLATLALVSTALAGCITLPGGDLTPQAAKAPRDILADATFAAHEDWSRTLVPGTLGRLPVEVVNVPGHEGTPINVGLFRPDTAEKVPVIVDAGPYYLDGDEGVDSATTHRLGGFLIDNFVPHGYAVAQVSVRGTGNSGGCSDFMGEGEQGDLDAVVTWLGEQEWSNGAVAMIGRSYDGSTPFQVAALGNPYLKTIVPISGIPNMRDLYFRNGSAEFRAPILGALYWTYGATDAGVGGPSVEPQSARVLCKDVAEHVVFGAEGWLDGGETPAGETDYWAIRNFKPGMLANYKGSMFLVHGLQDWNVHPDVVIPFYNELAIEKKALLGQWGHMYPDRAKEHEHLRWDWAEMLLRWFDRYLKGMDVDPGLYMEVEDSTNHWRIDPQNAFPASDATWTTFQLSSGGKLVASGAEAGEDTIANPADTRFGGPFATSVTLESEPLAAETLVTGLPQLHVKVRPEGPGGSLYATLYDVAGDEAVRIGHAQMDLRYAAGGYTPQPVVPGAEIVAKMEMYPLNARVLAGHSLRLVVTTEGGGNLPTVGPFPVTLVYGEESVLRLPVVLRAYEENRWDNPDAKNLSDGF